MTGPSHVTRLIDDVNNQRIALPDHITLWGEGGLPIFSDRLRTNITARIKLGMEIWLMVPDFRFGNNIFKHHQSFAELPTGYSNGFSNIDRTLITAERDKMMYDHAISILDRLVAECGGQLKLMFWCLAIREKQNLLKQKYINEQGDYVHPLWNYQAIIARYPNNALDIWPMTEAFSSYTIDSQGHPSVKAQAFIINTFQLKNGRQAFDYTEAAYKESINKLFKIDGGELQNSLPDYIYSPTPITIVGKSDMLFLAGDSQGGLKQHYGLMQYNDLQADAINKLLKARRDYFDLNQINYINLILPDKQTVYSDYLPIPIAADAERPSMQFLQLCKANNLATCYPAEIMINKNKQGLDTYDQVDTHCNAYGSFLAYQALVDQINTAFRMNVPKLKFSDISLYRVKAAGDLGSKLNPAVTGARVHSKIENAKAQLKFDSSHPTFTGDGVMKVYENATAEKTAIMFGNSYHYALLPFLAESFKRIVFVQSTIIDYSLVEYEKPDVVIYQSVERFLYWLPHEAENKFCIDQIFEKFRSTNRNHLLEYVEQYSLYESTMYSNLFLGLALTALRDYQTAEKHLEFAYKQNPHMTSLTKYLCLCGVGSGSYQNAIEAFHLASKLGEDVFALRPFRDDVNKAKQAISYDPSWAYPYFQIALNEVVNKKFKVALTYLKKIASTVDNSATIECLIGKCHLWMSSPDTAIEHFRKAYLLNPSNVENLRFLVDYTFKTGQNQSCIEYLDEYLHLEHVDLQAMFKLGVCKLRLGLNVEAIKVLNGVVKLDPRNEGAYVQMGVAYKKLKDLPSAREAFQKAIEINPNNASAQRELDNTVILPA
jgi:tetratricopeptide (TPR) repeat protein